MAFFFRAVLFYGEAYYPGDIARIYVPQRAALSRSLAEGLLPWWDQHLGIGYPLLAEGEVGAMYPPNLLLFGPLLRWGVVPDVVDGVTLSILLHYALACLGFYLWGRALRLRASAALLGALAFGLGGFLIAHLSHVSILSVAAWMPWLFALSQRMLDAEATRRRNRWASLGLGAALALVTGLQFLAGHPQMSLLNLLPLGVFALWRLATAPRGERVALGAPWAAAMVAGLLIGLPQLLPAYRLAVLSQRGGGLDPEFFTGYSFHPLLTATFFSPFILGNPYPEGSVELMAYAGLLPLCLAIVALWRTRERQAPAWHQNALPMAALGVIGLLMAFGRWNPLYLHLQAVPLLNLFRIPARYLAWTSLALATLAAMGADALQRAAPSGTDRVGGALILLPVGVSVAAIAVALALRSDVVLATGAARDVSALIAAWRWLPLALALGCVGLLVAVRRTAAPMWALAACLLLGADLAAYGAVLEDTYNATWPRAEAVRPPESLRFFRQDEGLYRMYVKEEIVPALSVQRESFYPNMAATWGLSGANLYLPLVPRSYYEVLQDLDAERLNAMNVRYYLIPQLLPVDEAAELYDVHNPFSALPVERWLEIEGQEVQGIEVTSFLSHAAHLPQGALAAELLLRGDDGRIETLPLRAGIESAEWAYARHDVARVIAHDMPEVANTWPARSGFPPGEHPGQSYRATWWFEPPLEVTAVMLRLTLPEAHVRVERVRLHTADGDEALLGHLLGLGDHEIVYRSEDVLIYRNHDALPRAYIVAEEQMIRHEDGDLSLPSPLRAGEVREVEVLRYEDDVVELLADLDEPGYLVLADLHYPGWQATVDGQSTPILALGLPGADRGAGAPPALRAIALPLGQHAVRFIYRPF